MYIGSKIKQLRKQLGISLKELAEKSGVQIATLSRMENLKMIGTLDSHMNIAKALGVDLVSLYQDPPSSQASLNKESEERDDHMTETFTYNEKASYEILTGNLLSKKMMPVVLRIEQGGITNSEQNAAGSEKFLFVLQGQVTAHVAEKKYSLTQNMTLYFDASQKYFFENKGKGTAKILLVTTPVAL